MADYELILTDGKPRYPVEPLIDYLHSRGITEFKEMSEACGKPDEWMSRLLKRKEEEPTTGLTDLVADEVAVNLGHHPLAIWGNLYWEYLKHG